ncbi:isocitrate lyase/PEP mutase family protein [Nocardioides soli]|uniref:Methylisocitrate lyase n=1 Tax=Nocardioides soli TaxID=1036020 RepID=A0A7W4VXH3_9ACTN|nr:isocitrate lyase/phosphoenolpyruvate mutase family protein [Nocardioides soli]MBB3043616.1 methylisocitrate lyase [Nocardioides soli]
MTAQPAAQRLRAILGGPDLVHFPGVYDAVGARLAVRAGVRGAHLSGAVASAVGLGLPDLGFVHAGDIVRVARGVVPALDGQPLLADADTGYGNALQARVTAQAYAAAGIAGLHLEDQVAPKRCGHLAGKQVVDVAEAAARVRAAVEAGSGIVVVARTDALGVEGVASATERCVAFAEAGADAVFVEGAGLSDLARVVEGVIRAAGACPPLVVNRSEAAGDQPALDHDALGELGVRVVIHPVSALLAAARAQEAVYAAIAATGDAGGVDRLGWDDLTTLVGLPDLLALEQRYAAGDPA